MPRFQRREPKRQHQSLGWGQIELNTSSGLGIYARQSTLAQVKNYRQSTEMQTDDLVAYAKRLGWDEEHIILFTQDLAKSGRLRIDQREGLRCLIERIEAGEIKTVLVFLEDRLFRDETGIQYNVFIDVCKRHGVYVVTPHMTYDFNIPFHVKQFRWRCEEAADYLRDYIIHRLQGARSRILESGRWAGRAIPIGYIVDNRESLIEDGSIVPNPNHRKFIPYEPHAKIVRWLFTRYWEIGGKVRPLCRELQQHPFIFPDFEPDVDVTKFLRFYQLKRVPGGYHLSRHGLTGLLTNVAYIGHWVHQGEVVKKHNHEPIVDEELFWYAFNRLSPYTITGERNEQKNGYIRYARKEPIPALLKNVIGSREGGRVYVSTSGLTEKPMYIIEERDQRLVLKFHAATPCKEIDDLFANRLVERMRQTTRYEHYQEYAVQLAQERVQLTSSIDKQLAEISKQMDGILTTLSLPPEKVKKNLRERLAERYAMLEEQKEELEAKRANLNTDQTPQKLMEFSLLADRIATEWERIPFADRQALADAIVRGVYLDEMAAHWLRLEVEWLDPQWGTERIYLFRPGGAHKTWTEAENDIIRTFLPEGAKEEILEKLPRRSWLAIMQQGKKLGVYRKRNLVSTFIPETLSMEDLAFMQQAGIAVGETSCYTWESVSGLASLNTSWQTAIMPIARRLPR